MMLVERMCFNMEKICKLYHDYHTEKLSMYNYLYNKGFVPDRKMISWNNVERFVWFYQLTDELIKTLNWYMIERNIDIRFEKG